MYKMSGAAGKRHNLSPLPEGHTKESKHPRDVLMNSLLELLNKEEIIDPDQLSKASTEDKETIFTQAIINVNSKFTTVHDIVNEANDGLDPRITECEETMEILSTENKQLRFELDLLKGMFFKLEAENNQLREKVTILSAAGMKNNITFGGLCGDENTENPIEVVFEFLSEMMNLEFPKQQIQSARRIGVFFKPEQPRLMAVQLNAELRDLVMSNLKALKGKKNANDKSYSIKKQLPDQWTEERRRLKEAIEKAKKVNEAKPTGHEPDKIEVHKGNLYVNNTLQKLQPLSPPKPNEIFVDKAEQDRIDKIKLKHSMPQEEGGSKFTAFAVKLQSLAEVRRAYVKMKQLYPSAPHILAAYAIKNNEGYQDDKEHGAAVRVLKTLKQQSTTNTNVAVYVVQEYDGKHIGPRRHQMIERAVIEALAKLK